MALQAYKNHTKRKKIINTFSDPMFYEIYWHKKDDTMTQNMLLVVDYLLTCSKSMASQPAGMN